MTLVKICGITNLDDALAAFDAGAGLLGFNFYPHSPRYIEPKVARSIIDKLPDGIITVGVFVNEDLEAVKKTAAATGVMMLQLHGDESPDYCRKLREKGRTVIKVFNTGEGFTLEKILEYDLQFIMLDAGGAATRGGTGQLSDWSQARQATLINPTCFLAGGLSPENVGAAIEEVEPFGVDACSALEQAPGQKDHERVRDFVAAVLKASPHHDCRRRRGLFGMLQRWGIIK
ncbi:MAG: phosphoribosylanthranilate isomerase [Pyrinomonadaceae bacterium]